MTEDQIERRIERRIDSADRALMNGHLSQAEYEAHIRDLNQWAEAEYAAAKAEG